MAVQDPIVTTDQLALVKIAAIIDSEVVEVFTISERQRAILLSNPLLVDLGYNPERIQETDLYDNESGTFIKLEDAMTRAAKLKELEDARKAAETTN